MTANVEGSILVGGPVAGPCAVEVARLLKTDPAIDHRLRVARRRARARARRRPPPPRSRRGSAGRGRARTRPARLRRIEFERAAEIGDRGLGVARVSRRLARARRQRLAIVLGDRERRRVSGTDRETRLGRRVRGAQDRRASGRAAPSVAAPRRRRAPAREARRPALPPRRSAAPCRRRSPRSGSRSSAAACGHPRTVGEAGAEGKAARGACDAGFG